MVPDPLASGEHRGEAAERRGDGGGSSAGEVTRLDLLKTLGDNTRYAIYLELARSPVPRTTAEIAEVLDLHVNTVRPHLERMREVGLLEVDAEARGGVGRPQHRYALAPEAPSLGLEPSPWPTLAKVLLQAAVDGGLDGAELADAGEAQGRADAAVHPGSHDCFDALVAEQTRMGFDPELVVEGEAATVAFAHCPFRELAEEQPELVCSLHCGMISGFVEGLAGARVTRFHPLVDRTPCQVELARTCPCRRRCCRRPPIPLQRHVEEVRNVITISENAAVKVKDLITQEGDDSLMLRVAVRPGGCSGFSYEMFFDSERDGEDVTSELHGVTVVVDPSSAMLLEGATLDYSDGLQGAGFSINNPNAQRTCGCGQSFS